MKNCAKCGRPLAAHVKRPGVKSARRGVRSAHKCRARAKSRTKSRAKKASRTRVKATKVHRKRPAVPVAKKRIKRISTSRRPAPARKPQPPINVAPPVQTIVTPPPPPPIAPQPALDSTETTRRTIKVEWPEPPKAANPETPAPAPPATTKLSDLEQTLRRLLEEYASRDRNIQISVELSLPAATAAVAQAREAGPVTSENPRPKTKAHEKARRRARKPSLSRAPQPHPPAMPSPVVVTRPLHAAAPEAVTPTPNPERFTAPTPELSRLVTPTPAEPQAAEEGKSHPALEMIAANTDPTVDVGQGLLFDEPTDSSRGFDTAFGTNPYSPIASAHAAAPETTTASPASETATVVEQIAAPEPVPAPVEEAAETATEETAEAAPARNPGALVWTVERRPETSGAGRKKILVVDDDAVMRMLLRMGLGSHSYECAVAENGRAAQEKVESFRPDLILVDLLMPIMDGLSFLQWLRQTAHNTTPVLVLTNVNDPRILEEARLCGADGFACKPVHLKKLLEEIGRLVPV